jgi:type II secretory pathway component PulF
MSGREMPEFAYVAVGPDGQRRRGTAVAASEDALADQLRRKQEYLVEAGPADRRADLASMRVLDRVTRRDVIFFTSQLAAVIGAGVNLVEGLVEMGDRAEHMVRAALDSFAKRDVEVARSLVELDELIDRTNRRVVDHVLQMAAQPGQQEWGMRMIVVARCIERIGDNAVDIGEQTSFVVTGEFQEFTDASH